MKRTIAIIVLSLIIVALIVFDTAYFLKSKKNQTKQIEKNKELLTYLDTQLEERDKVIKNLIANPKIITKEKIISLPDQEKTKLIIDQQNSLNKLTDIIRQDSLIIETLKDNLKKSTEIMNTPQLKHNVSLFVLAGIDTTKNIDIYAGLLYRYYFIPRMYAGCGGAIKLYQNIGGSLIFELGIAF